ncbi:MAG: NifB/NifX family molybdenum-iron cluster-binding protein [Armatimonadetes bacterium]|nr:NifB/NifX family molybdenum-iron cluster-binding protein [Armatimonadota bacterium]
MRIAVAVLRPSTDAPVAESFCDCAYLVIVDTQTFSHEALPTGAEGETEKCARAARLIADAAVGAVVAGNFCPTCFRALDRAGILICVPLPGTSVQEAVEAICRGELPPLNAPRPPARTGARGSLGLLPDRTTQWCREAEGATATRAIAGGAPTTPRCGQTLPVTSSAPGFDELPDIAAIHALREQLDFLRRQIEALQRHIKQKNGDHRGCGVDQPRK